MYFFERPTEGADHFDLPVTCVHAYLPTHRCMMVYADVFSILAVYIHSPYIDIDIPVYIFVYTYIYTHTHTFASTMY